ncbi:putative transcription factor C3H family [Rosa chinensis]|uniref:Putative transcription factor C3H family n=1 Tax=Rosa chinensis TaxID=74649 RepID=A0A2P6Q6Z7_ROSCH|nr:putative transcription factor C3H family [Rosa chinensis]
MELSESSSSVSPNLDLHIGNSNEIDQVQLNHSDIGSQRSTAADQQLDNHSGGDAAVSHSSPDPDVVDVVDHAVVDEIGRLDLRGDDVAVEVAAAEVEEKKEEGGEVEAEEKSSNGGGGEINESERQSEEEENRSENGGEGEKKGGEYNRRYQYPVRPEAEECSFYPKTGNCKFGSNRRFNHPVRRKNNQVFKDKVKEKDELSEKPSQTECKYYLRPGGCKYGEACRYNHGKGKPSVAPVVELNFLGLPIRRGKRECPYYMRNGSCKYGSNCRFNHPNPTAAGGSDPPSGFDNGGPASLQGGSQSSSWSAPRSLNETPLCMPMMMPPSQGVPSQNTEWNGYQSPVYLERSMPARPPYVINNSGTKTKVYKQYPPSNQVDEFQERPGQRLCSFFLRTGDCKFKSNCKYHHPKSQTEVSPSFALSDKGLPLRPLFRPAYAIMLTHLRSEALENFKIRLERSLVQREGFASSIIAHSESCMREFDQACADVAINSNGNAYGIDKEKAKRKLKCDIEAYASSQLDEQLSRLKLDCERQLWEALSLNDPIAALLRDGDDDIWRKKRGLLHDAIELVDERFSNEINGYALDQGRSAEMLQILRDYARRVAKEKPRQEASCVLTHMINRFLQAFNYDSDENARTWTVGVDIRIITHSARHESLKILSTLAAIRLDKTQDDIERVLSSTLIGGEISSTNVLDSVTWDMVSSNDTLITPLECQSLWRQFKEQTEPAIFQAYATQVLHRRINSAPNDDAPNDPEFSPFIWIIVVIVVLLSTAYGIPNAASLVPEILALLPRFRSQALTLSAIIVAVKKIVEAYRNRRLQK